MVHQHESVRPYQDDVELLLLPSNVSTWCPELTRHHELFFLFAPFICCWSSLYWTWVNSTCASRLWIRCSNEAMYTLSSCIGLVPGAKSRGVAVWDVLQDEEQVDGMGEYIVGWVWQWVEGLHDWALSGSSDKGCEELGGVEVGWGPEEKAEKCRVWAKG